jgi:hypothetical protein
MCRVPLYFQAGQNAVLGLAYHDNRRRGLWRTCEHVACCVSIIDTGPNPGLFPLGPVPKVRHRSSLFIASLGISKTAPRPGFEKPGEQRGDFWRAGLAASGLVGLFLPTVLQCPDKLL